MTKPGHNSRAAGPISADRLKSFIERIEKMEEERKAIGGDIRDIYAEAKGVGYDVKTMRKIVSLRAMDAADRAEAETLLDTYCHALGMVYTSADFSEDALVEQASRIVSEVDRCMDLVTDGQPPGIYAIQELIGCSTGKASKLRGMVADRISRSEAKVREMKQPEDGDDGITVSTGGPVAVRNEGGGHDAGHLSNSRRHQNFEDDTVDESLAAGVAAQADGDDDGVRPRGVLTPEPEVARAAPPASDDDLAIPPFLRGSRQGRGA